jgi:DNA-binding FrmR family transcriptional regulator
MSHTHKDSKKILTRVRRIKGQAQALEKLLETQADCSQVLQQIAAIRGATNGLMTQVLEGHIREHLGDATISELERHNEVEQVIQILKSYLK